MVLSNKDALLLEEIFQLLRESLAYCPFNPENNSPTKKHITRYKQLLGPEFLFWLSETGSLFYAVLIVVKVKVDNLPKTFSNSAQIKNLHNHLLFVSQLAMHLGPYSTRCIDSIMQLNTILNYETNHYKEIYEVVDDALVKLQSYMCEEIIV